VIDGYWDWRLSFNPGSAFGLFDSQTGARDTLLGAINPRAAGSTVYNVALGDRTTLNQLYGYLKEILGANGVPVTREPAYVGFRNGDVRHSQADVGKAMRELGYMPTHRIRAGLEAVIPWYVEQNRNQNRAQSRAAQQQA